MELNFKRWDATLPNSARLVCLHGMGGTGALWRPLAAALEAEVSVFAPDQRGHGQSRVPAGSGQRKAPGYAPLDYGQDVVETLRAQSFHPTLLLGHSMGVRTACAVAHLKPEWVQGLILIDLGFSGVAGGGLGEGLAHFIKILPHRFEDRVQARAFMKKECPDPSIAQYLLAVACREGEGPALTFPFDHSALIETIFAARDSSVRSWALDTAAHGTPMLILRGEKSLVWSKTDFESERAHFASYPHVKFEEVADAGHGLPFERRLELASLITQMSATYRLS